MNLHLGVGDPAPAKKPRRKRRKRGADPHALLRTVVARGFAVIVMAASLFAIGFFSWTMHVHRTDGIVSEARIVEYQDERRKPMILVVELRTPGGPTLVRLHDRIPDLAVGKIVQIRYRYDAGVVSKARLADGWAWPSIGIVVAAAVGGVGVFLWRRGWPLPDFMKPLGGGSVTG